MTQTHSAPVISREFIVSHTCYHYTPKHREPRLIKLTIFALRLLSFALKSFPSYGSCLFSLFISTNAGNSSVCIKHGFAYQSDCKIPSTTLYLRCSCSCLSDRSYQDSCHANMGFKRNTIVLACFLLQLCDCQTVSNHSQTILTPTTTSGRAHSSSQLRSFFLLIDAADCNLCQLDPTGSTGIYGGAGR